MRLQHVLLNNFPPFADGIVSFPPGNQPDSKGEVHLFTGPNGSGKTRLLSVLAAALGNNTELKNRSNDNTASKIRLIVCEESRSAIWDSNTNRYAKVNGSIDPETLRKNPDAVYITKVVGSLLEAFDRKSEHPLALAFRGMARVSDADVVPLGPLDLGSRSNHLLFDPAPNEDKLIGQSMTNLKLGAVMERMPKNEDGRAGRMCARLEAAVTKITGHEFSFSVKPHPKVSLVVNWRGTEMRLAQLPDGLRSIIGWLAACVAKLDAAYPEHADPLSLPLILLLDEPEGHLHPSWQRKVIPAAKALFPQAIIFAATHSPFVISSVNEGWIYVFRADDKGIVTVEKPRPCSKGDSYLDVIEDILGVTEWYDPETEALLADFRSTRDEVLGGRWDKEPALQEKSRSIATRSPALEDMMAREMRKLERIKTQTQAAAA